MSKVASKVYYKDGTTSEVLDHSKTLHRTDGPAIILFSKNGKVIGKSWYLDDVEYTEEEFNTIIQGDKHD